MTPSVRKLGKLCVVVPGLNEEENVPILYRDLIHHLGQSSWKIEIVFVDDGSTDRTLEVCREIHEKDPRFQYVSLSRNFGHQRALTAGLDLASGDAVVVMDADLQDPPAVVLEMIKLWEQGVDVAYGQRKHRSGETFFKKFTAKMFYKTLRALSGSNIPPDTGDFRLMDIRVVEELCKLREQARFMRGIVHWIGFKQAPVLYDRPERHAGTSKYPLLRMLRFAWDGITSFSVIPLRLAILAGFVFSVFAFCLITYWIIRQIFFHDFVAGWASIMVAIFGVGSVQLLFTGIVGEYLAKSFEELKGRPLYIARERSRPLVTHE